MKIQFKTTSFFILMLWYSSLLLGQDSSNIHIKLYPDSTALYFDFYDADLIHPDLQTSLQKGVTIGLEYKIILWKIRPLVYKLITERQVRYKIQYDHWDKLYFIRTSKGDSCYVNSMSSQDCCLYLMDLEIGDLDKLNPDDHYRITLEIILHPLSLDNFSEVNRWVSGEIKQIQPGKISSTPSPGKKVSKWMLKLLVNISGFGDRIKQINSSDFSIADNEIIFIED